MANNNSPPLTNMPFHFEGNYREQQTYNADDSIASQDNTVLDTTAQNLGDVQDHTAQNTQHENVTENVDTNTQQTGNTANGQANADPNNQGNQQNTNNVQVDENTQQGDNTTQQQHQAQSPHVQHVHIEPNVRIQNTQDTRIPPEARTQHRSQNTPPLIRTHRMRSPGDFDRIQRVSTIIDNQQTHTGRGQGLPTNSAFRTVQNTRTQQSQPAMDSYPPITRQRTRQDSMQSLLHGFENLQVRPDSRATLPFPEPPITRTTRPHTITKPPTYIPVAQQALQMHKDAIKESINKADMFQQLAQLLIESKLQSNQTISSNFESIAKNIASEVQKTKQQAEIRTQGIERAAKVVDYYQTPIQKPQIPTQNDYYEVRLNLRELIMITGYFDPTNPNADFKHVWHKLLDYGQSQNYAEKHYMTALGAILQKEAYETFCDFKQGDRSLDDILQYFAKVYTKQRSAMDDRDAVDGFTRKKGESIVVCMDRCILAIDKLRLKYDSQVWPHIREFMRKNILMQVIKTETKRHIQIKEDEITETTGLPYDFDNLIKEADRFERYNDKMPDKEVQCMFKVASGGLVNKAQENTKTAEQLQHFKREQKLDQLLQTLVTRLENLEVNAVAPRPFKNQGKPEEQRQSRSRERFSQMKSRREASMNKGRNLTDDEDQEMEDVSKARTDNPQKLLKPQKVPYKPATPYVPRDPYAQATKPAPSQDLLSHGQVSHGQPQTQRPPSQPPQQGSQRPSYTQQQYSNQYPNAQWSNRQPSPSPYQGRQQSRSPMRAATPYNFQQYSRNNSQSNSRPQSQNRSWSQNRNQQSEQFRTKNAKSVYISINGQDYMAVPKPEN